MNQLSAMIVLRRTLKRAKGRKTLQKMQKKAPLYSEAQLNYYSFRNLV